MFRLSLTSLSAYLESLRGPCRSYEYEALLIVYLLLCQVLSSSEKPTFSFCLSISCLCCPCLLHYNEDLLFSGSCLILFKLNIVSTYLFLIAAIPISISSLVHFKSPYFSTSPISSYEFDAKLYLPRGSHNSFLRPT